ncbi:MAG: hypothetical protein JXQ30_16940 [Spirochaetes bacterium]|nr:hypothetical protein [Spirochaetota bacterium]
MKKLKKSRKKNKTRAALLKGGLFVLALFVLPFTVSLILNLPDLFSRYDRVTEKMLSSIGGFVFFVVLFLLFGPPVKSYILEHELSHIVFAFLSGVRVRQVVIRKHDGYVKTEKVNLAIALAPYSLPLYTLFTFAIYRAAALFCDGTLLGLCFYFLLGLTLAFHLVATVHYLQLDQPDLRRYGYFPSLILIFTWSLVILSLLSALLFERVEVFGYFQNVAAQGALFYRTVVRYFFA